jgi:hypothetical protein
MLKWINSVLKDEDTMALISTIIIVVAPFIALIIWGGFLKNLKFEGFAYKDVGIFTLIYTYAVLTNRIKFRENGQRIEVKNNEELKADIDKIEAFEFKREDDIIGMKFVNELNEREQERANKVLTDKEIMRLLNKKRSKMVNNKPYEYLDDKIDELEKNNLIDTKFIYYEHKDIIKSNLNLIESTKQENGSSIRHNVAWAGFKLAIFIEIAKGIGYGSAIIGFLWGLPLDATIAYILFLIFGILSTAIIQTILAVFDTRTNYHNSLTIKLKRMQECKEYIDLEIEKIQRKKKLREDVDSYNKEERENKENKKEV